MRFSFSASSYTKCIVTDVPWLDGRFSCFYGGQGMGPLMFSRWVKKQGYTFKGKKLLWEGLDCTDFRGVLNEIPCSFSFRIYSKSLIEEVRKAIR
jgi:hypothetical protein